MKRYHILTTVIALLLVLSCSTPAYAVNNTMKGDTSANAATASGNGPSAADIKLASDGNKVTLPKQYNSSYRLDYVSPNNGNYAYVYRSTNSDAKQANAYEGTQVLVLSDDVKTGFSCIIYRSDDNKLHAGWIYSQFLTSTYPNNTTYKNRAMSTKYQYKSYNLIDASWSGDYFVGTKTKYIVLDETMDNVISLTLNYQIYAKNGIYNCSGMRDVYYNDGNGWECVGSFDVDSTLPSVQYTMNFTSPVTVEAVAVVPQDLSIQGFLFNEFVDTVCITD